MCGRFAVTTDPALLAEKIKALDEATEAAQQAGRNSAVVPNYNVAPTTTVSTVVYARARPSGNPSRITRTVEGPFSHSTASAWSSRLDGWWVVM